MHISISYVEASASTSMTTWAGISRINVAIFNGLAMGNLDAVEEEGETMDGYLSHASPTPFPQHAHSISPCASPTGGSTTVKPGTCDGDDDNCFPADFSYMLDGWSTK